MTLPTRTFGPHLLLDCYGADSKKLADLALIFDFLDSLPALIGMKKIGPPQLARFTEPANFGVTGIVMIVGSHISIHTYALKEVCFVDVFSCKEFDHAKVVDHVTATFGVGHCQSQLISRGDRFPVGNIHPLPGVTP